MIDLDDIQQERYADAEKALMAGHCKGAIPLLLPLKNAMESQAHWCIALGTAYFGVADYAESIRYFSRASALEPYNVAALTGLATALYQDQQGEMALPLFQKALSIDSSAVDTRVKCIALCRQLEQHELALKLLQEGLALSPEQPTLKAILANITGIVTPAAPLTTSTQTLSADAPWERLWQAKDYAGLIGALHQRLHQPQAAKCSADALVYLQALCELRPLESSVWYLRALAHHHLGEMGQSLPHYRRALQLDNHHQLLLSNATMAFNKAFEFAAGEYCHQRFIHLGGPITAPLLLNQAFAEFEQGHYSRAIALYQQVEQNQSSELSQLSLGLLHLLQGDFAQGWAFYSIRLGQIKQYQRVLQKGIAPWQGEALQDKVLVIVYEQGHGDTLQFLRFIPALCQQATQVIFQVNPRLASLLQTQLASYPNCRVTTKNVVQGDYVVPLLELARLLHLDEKAIRATPSPYVHADPHKQVAWQARFAALRGCKIGLAWAGNPDNQRDRIRSCTLSQLAPILSVGGCDFISLQYGTPLSKPWSDLMDDCSPAIHDFSDTAALVAQLDLVITVDTAVAHLAAAMGKPVWLLISYVPDWRWQLERSDSPWYPSVRLYRQSALWDWQTPIARMREDLIAHVGQKPCTQAQLELLFSQNYPELAYQALETKQVGIDAQTQAFLQVQAYVRTGRYTQGLKLAAQLTAHAEPRADHLYYQGCLALKLRDFAQAFQLFNQAVALAPDQKDYFIQLVSTALKLGQTTYALELLNLALQSAQDDFALGLQMSYALLCQHQFRAAEDCLQQLLVRHPSQRLSGFALSQVYLLQGDFTQGWHWFEQRPVAVREAFLPTWRGPLHTKTPIQLYLYSEQGLGDQIQFLRYLPHLLTYCQHLYVQLDARLIPLMEGQFAQVTLLDTLHIPGAADYQLSLCSLPYVLGEQWRFNDFGRAYLQAPHTMPAPFNAWCQANAAKRRIGLVWAGNPAHEKDDERSMALSRLAPLFDLPHCAFCALQQGEALHEVQAYPAIFHASDSLQDLAHTAAVIEVLDLVISVDTSVAHLAGALGKPCWILLPYLPDWRWQLNSERSDWYDSVRLFRQPSIGDWDSVVGRIREALQSY